MELLKDAFLASVRLYFFPELRCFMEYLFYFFLVYFVMITKCVDKIKGSGLDTLEHSTVNFCFEITFQWKSILYWKKRSQN